MARPKKTGLEFYSLDTDIFSNRKIRRLIKNFGANGYLIYSYVLTEIYRDKGCFIVWDEDTAFDVSDYLNLKETVVSEVINYCCNVGLFNKELRTSGGILTSKNIQEFWVSVSKKAKRTDITISEAFNLIPEETTSNEEETTSNEEETTSNEEESTQSKVKESKLKKTLQKNLQTFKKQIGEDEQWKEIFYMKYRTKKNTLIKIINEFNKECLLKEKSHNSLKDYKEHLLNWCNVQNRIGNLDKYKLKKKTTPKRQVGDI